MAVELLSRVRRELRAVADPARAPAMQAYMKSAVPYLGVGAVPLRAVCRALFADLALPDAATWRGRVLELWRGARHREERYAAIELAGHRRARTFQDLDALPMYEEMMKRRSAILSQIRFKADTDLDLLYACLEPSLGSREFFLRKAIGWALRQYAWTNPGEVARYVKANEDCLSGLSRREALKNATRRPAPG